MSLTTIVKVTGPAPGSEVVGETVLTTLSRALPR